VSLTGAIVLAGAATPEEMKHEPYNRNSGASPAGAGGFHEQGIAAPNDGLPGGGSDTDVSSATIHREGDSKEYLLDEELAAAGEDNRQRLRQKVKDAGILYSRAIESYAGGNLAGAQDMYTKALNALSSAGVDADIQYMMHEDFCNLFAKIEKLLGNKNIRSRQGDSKYSVDMDTDNELVQKHLKYFSEGAGRHALQQALARSARYRPLIERILQEYDLPRELVYLPVVESMYDNNDVSRAGAVGLWQLMPDRARYLGLKVNCWIDERKDPAKATRAACRYLKQLYLMFDDWPMALAAYNRGEYGLMRDMYFARATTISEVVERRAMPRETIYFVPQFIACTLVADNAEKYGLQITGEQPLDYDTVRIDSLVDLKVVARCSGSTIREIRKLNPSLKAWCTPRHYPDFELHLPPGTREIFIKNISREKNLNPVGGYIKYLVARGDRLDTIARKFGTSVRALQRDNRINDPRQVKMCQVLLIRPDINCLADVGE
jgi:membrane-bound lytic murein transglycosylase D